MSDTQILSIYVAFSLHEEAGSTLFLLHFSPLQNEEIHSTKEHVSKIDFVFNILRKNTDNIVLLVENSCRER